MVGTLRGVASKDNAVDSVNGQTGVVVLDAEDVGAVADNDPNYLRTLTSGVLYGCQVTINADDTKFDIAAGAYLIVDCWTDPEEPVAYPVVYAGSTGNTTTNLAGSDFSHILLDQSGNVIQQSAAPDAVDRRAYVQLAQLGHTSRTSIASVVPLYQTAASPIQTLRDFIAALGGVINIGNGVSANGSNLSINKADGRIFGEGVYGDSSDPSANVATTPAVSAPTLRHRTQTGEGVANSAFIDPSNWDVGGTLTSLSATKYTNQRIWLFPNGNIVVSYGQAQYNSLSAAVAGINSESFVPFPNLSESAVLIGVLSVRSTATALNNTSHATFSLPPTSGGAVGSVIATLQSVYDNSTTPEILTDSTRGAVTVRRGSAADTDNVLEGQNNAGTTTFAVTGNGLVTSNTLTASTILSANGSKGIVSLSTGTYPSLAELARVKGVTSSIQTQLNAKASGAASSTDNAIARYDGTTGKVIQNSGATISDDGITLTIGDATDNIVSVGVNNDVTGVTQKGVTLGANNIATGFAAAAIGVDNDGGGRNIGSNNSMTSGDGIGRNNIGEGISIGSACTSHLAGIAMGASSQATASNSLCFGQFSSATDTFATAFGSFANATGFLSFALGVAANASGNTSLSIGRSANASGANSSVFGVGQAGIVDNSTDNSLMFAYDDTNFLMTATEISCSFGQVFNNDGSISANAYDTAINALGDITGAVEIDLADGAYITATLTGAITPTFTGLPAAGYNREFTLAFTNVETITYPAGTRFAGGVAPTIIGTDYEISCGIDSAGTLTVYGVVDAIS